MRMINGTNSRMLARFTGKTIPQEARKAKVALTSFVALTSSGQFALAGLNGWVTY